jgi:hypothetical protein
MASPMPIETQDDMRCPTCGARQMWADTCRRCKCDLRLLRAAVGSFEQHRRTCLRLLDTGFPRQALRHARSCQGLEPGADAERLMALCYLLLGRWEDALAGFRRVDAQGPVR